MANIRVNLSRHIVDGELVTFRSPTNCSEVSGLIVYYPNGDTTASKTFQFADAHGNNVGTKNLFAADVLVRVLLDTEKSRAYVQNADTNAYLESRFDGKANNLNLLDNWYFGNPVDQRGGYVVSPDTPYYSDTDLTTQAGTVSAYTKATQVNSTYGTITVSGTTYYVAWSAAVRGYTGAGYTIDRWRSDGRLVVLVEADGIRIINTGESGTTFIQNGELQKAASLAGLNVSGAVVYKATGFVTMYSWVENAGNSLDMVLSPTQNWSLASCYAEAVTDETAQQYIAIGFYLNSGAELCLKAAKLELGAQQTLAHQDENGNWVLNDLPLDKNMELLKCCMSTADPNDTYANNNKTPASIGAVASTQGTATLPAAASWISNSTVGERAYYVDIAIAPLTADNDIFIDRAYTVDKASDDAYAAAFSCVSTWVQSAGTLRAYAETPPESACPMNWTVID